MPGSPGVEGAAMWLYMPRLARRGIAVVRLRGVLTGASACRLTVPLRHAFTADPQLLVTDLAGLRGWDDCGQSQLADVAAYLVARGGQMALSAVGARLQCTEPRLASLKVFADVPAVLAAVNDGNPAPPVIRAPGAEEHGPRGWGLVIVTSCAHAHGWYPDACLGMPGKTVWFARRVQPRLPRS